MYTSVRIAFATRRSDTIGFRPKAFSIREEAIAIRRFRGAEPWCMVILVFPMFRKMSRFPMLPRTERLNPNPVRQALRLFRLCRQIGLDSPPERVRARMVSALGLSQNVEDGSR